MANLHITEYSYLAASDQGDGLLAIAEDAFVASQVVLLGVASVQSAAFHTLSPPNTKTPIQQPTVPATKSTRWVVLVAGAPCSVLFGTNPVVVAGTNGQFMNTGDKIIARVPEGLSWKVAAINDAL
jgi:hypothetical protein